MPNDTTPVSATPVTLPAGYCPPSWQDLVNKAVGESTYVLPGKYRTYNYGNSEPVANDRDKPWRRLAADGAPDDWYDYFNGQWVRKYRIPASSKERMIWTGSLSDLWAYDGGNGIDPASVAPTETTGPFWEEDKAFAVRAPIGVGKFSDSEITVGVLETVGSERVALTLGQLPVHRAEIPGAVAVQAGGSGSTAILGFNNTGLASVFSKPIGEGDKVSRVQPSIGVYFAKRTIRKYVTI